MKWILFLIIWMHLPLQAQRAYGVGFRMNKEEFYFRFSLSEIKEKVQFEGGVGFGLLNTVFQQVWHPELFGRASLLVLNKASMQFGLSIHALAHTYEYNPITHARMYGSEILSGLLFQAGKDWKFQIHAEYGIASQWQQTGAHWTNHRFPSYSGQIGLAHVF